MPDEKRDALRDLLVLMEQAVGVTEERAWILTTAILWHEDNASSRTAASGKLKVVYQ